MNSRSEQSGATGSLGTAEGRKARAAVTSSRCDGKPKVILCSGAPYRDALAALATGGWHVSGGATGSLGGAEGRKALPLAYDI
jgi:hypothetical protein